MRRHRVWGVGTVMIAVIVIAGMILSACAPTPQEPQIIRETVEVEVVKTVEVEVEKVVEKTVQVEVKETVVVEVTPTPAPKGGRVILGTDKYPSGLDPHVQVAWDVLRLVGVVYDPLVWLDPDTGEFVPGLAESWDVSPDGTTYTFQLRQGVTFHDGTPFNAEAVKFNLERMVDPETKSQAAKGLLGPFESAEVIDEFTIAIQLSEPYAYLLHGLSMTYTAMCSPAAIEKWGVDYELHQVGTGPFMIQEYNPKDKMVLVPNPDYNWAPSLFSHQGPPYLEEVVWRFLPEAAARVPAMETGDVHVAFSIPPHEGNRLMNDPRFNLEIVNLAGQPLYYFMNIEKEPLDDIQVRKAILHAVDQQSIINATLRGFYTPATGPLSAVTAEYTPEVQGLYPYDLEQAKALLDDAGWVESPSGIRMKDGQPLTLQMSLQGWGFIPPIGEMLQAQLRMVGINVEAEMMSWPAQLEAGIAGAKHMTVMGGSGFFATDALTGFFHSSNADGGFNWSKIRSPELDALLSAGAQEQDLEKRKEIYGQAQMFIMEQALIVPIYDYSLLVGVDRQLQGLRWDTSGLTPWLYDAYTE